MTTIAVAHLRRRARPRRGRRTAARGAGRGRRLTPGRRSGMTPGVDWSAVRPRPGAQHLGLPAAPRRVPRLGLELPRVANPVDVLVWNTDKRYLDDLAAAGLPTVPTVFVPPGSDWPAPAGDLVVKPTVSGSAADTGRFGHPVDPAAAALVARLHAQGRTVMVQPYLPGIEVEGDQRRVRRGPLPRRPACPAAHLHRRAHTGWGRRRLAELRRVQLTTSSARSPRPRWTPSRVAGTTCTPGSTSSPAPAAGRPGSGGHGLPPLPVCPPAARRRGRDVLAGI